MVFTVISIHTRVDFIFKKIVSGNSIHVRVDKNQECQYCHSLIVKKNIELIIKLNQWTRDKNVNGKENWTKIQMNEKSKRTKRAAYCELVHLVQ